MKTDRKTAFTASLCKSVSVSTKSEIHDIQKEDFANLMVQTWK